MTYTMVALVAGLTLAGACRESAMQVPVVPESIAGRVTRVQRSGERIGSVRVEAQPLDSAGSAKAVVRITQRTAVMGASSTRRDFNALQVGQWIRVWFMGPVRESYPVQADARTIVIDSSAAQR